MKFHIRETLKFYWAEARRQRAAGIVLLFGTIFASAITVVVPLYYKRFFDVLVTNADTRQTDIAYSLLWYIAGFLLLEWVLWRISGLATIRFEAQIMGSLAKKCFAYLHKHSFAFFQNNFVGSLVKRVNYFVLAFEVVVDRIIWNVLQLLVSIIIILVVLFVRDWRLALFLMIWLIVFIAVSVIFTLKKLKIDVERSEAETRSTGILADTITNQSTVKLFTGFQSECDLYGQAMDEVTKWRTKSWILNSIFDGVQALFMIGLEVGMYVFAISLWQRGTLTAGDFVLLQSYLISIVLKTWDLGRVIRQVYENLADAEEMTAILLMPNEITDVPEAGELKIKAGMVEFKNVSFNYSETRQVIHKLNLQIAPHEKLAIVGPSGAGKTTIIRLLLRLYETTSGKIFVDGQPILSVTQDSLRRAVSLVPQDPLLFHRSLMDNIRYGRPNATEAEVIAAAKLAHCHEFISTLSEGYGTFVGERGVKLSGGERQRVAIARAILRNSPILVLDEATSSLDSESERLIQDALENLMKGKTVIAIAHRLSTIMKMDRIIVLKDGKVIEEGSHLDLVRRSDGLYATLWELQAGGFIQ